MTPRGKISLIMLFFAICGTAALLRHYTTPELQPPTHRELYSIVCEQLRAVRSDDYRSAYRQVSRQVQVKYPLSDFREMVQSSYPALINSFGLELGPVQIRGSRAYVEVYFTGPQHQIWPCIYTLIREGETWKIDGAQMLPRWPPGLPMSGVQA